MRKALVVVAAVILVVAGCLALFVGVTAKNISMSVPHYYWCISLVLSGPVFIGSGIWLFTFKRAAWKLGLVAYGLLLVQLAFLNICLYLIALHISGAPGKRPDPFSLTNIWGYLRTGVGIGFQIAFLACIVLAGIFVSSKRIFEGKLKGI